MGCDVWWSGNLKSVKQQKKLPFSSVVSLRRWSLTMMCTRDLSGHFIDVTNPRWKAWIPLEAMQGQNSRKLIGVSGYWYGRDRTLEWHFTDIAYRQISFVFDNTSEAVMKQDPALLVSVEEIDDLEAEKYLFMRERALAAHQSVHENEGIYAFRKGGYEQIVPSEDSHKLLWVLYLVKQLYFPNLTADDDYCVFEDITRWAIENDIQKALHTSKRISTVRQIVEKYLGIEFDPSAIRPELRLLWGVSLL